MKVYAKPDAAADEQRRMRLASALRARWIVLADPADHDLPIVREQLDAWAEFHALWVRLVGSGYPSPSIPWADVLSKLRDWCSDRKMPLIDTLRAQNGLTETFGEQCVRESVERELGARPGPHNIRPRQRVLPEAK